MRASSHRDYREKASTVQPKHPDRPELPVRLSKELEGMQMSASGGGFIKSAQHLLVLVDQGVPDGDITDMVHGSAKGGAVGALEGWVECCGDLAGAGSAEQDWGFSNSGAAWRHRSGAAPTSIGSTKA